MTEQKGFTILSLTLLALAFVLVFDGFWQHPIYIWDEAVYANNALGLLPDHYNTKPPLAIWLMAISMRIFGTNEFAVRLPSVLAFVATISILIRFSKKYLADYFPGMLASIILLGAKGLMLSHGARSGDLDSLLVLCTTLVCITAIEICLNNEPARINGLLRKGFLYILLGFFIKSTAILLVIPGIVICLIASKKAGTILRSRTFYSCAGLLLLIIVAYYLIAENLSPGYWKAAFFSEYQRIAVDVMPWHRQKPTWYLQNFFQERFKPYALFIVLSFITGLAAKEPVTKIIVRCIAIISVTYMLIISLVPDKLEWYDLPVYPILAFSLTTSVYQILQRWQSKHVIYRRIQVVLVLICALPVYQVIKNKQLPVNELEREAWCLKEIKKDRTDQHSIKVLMNTEHPAHKLSCEFYSKAWKNDKEILIVDYVTQLQAGDTVLYCQNNKSDSIKNSFRVDTIGKYVYGNLLKLY